LVISDTMEFVRSIRTAGLPTVETMETAITHERIQPSSSATIDTFEQPSKKEVVLSEADDLEINGELEDTTRPQPSYSGAATHDEETEREDTTSAVMEEPLVGTGIAATLALLKQKGMLEKANEEIFEAETRRSKRQKWLLEQNKLQAGSKEAGVKKQKRSKLGADDEVKRFEDYRPDISLSYTDEFGRQLNPKEAFKQLCFAFHGRGSGKNKTEKRLRKIQEELLQQKLAASDSSLSAMSSLQKRMEQSKTSYVVLSSGNKA
jgi:U4/U6.U5 tri-snRNP-associated protein 1